MLRREKQASEARQIVAGAGGVFHIIVDPR
jgi:hypothetical protein